MKSSQVLLVFAAITAGSFLSGCSSRTQNQQIKATYVSPSRDMPAVLYEPVVPGEKSQIAILVMHSDRNYLSFSACTELSKRGYRVLCANSAASNKFQPSKGNGLDGMLLDVKAAVDYLRKYTGVKKVVLWGHSGGGTLMSAYQDIAENGVKACQGPEKLYKCSSSLAGMPPADGVMLVDSNWGIAAMTLFALDPAVVNEDNGQKLNPVLDMFNSANGFKPSGDGVRVQGPAREGQQDPNSQTSSNKSGKGSPTPQVSTYTNEFIRKYLGAQGARENKLIKTALDKMAAIEAGKGHYADDEPFDIPGASNSFMNSKLYAFDTRLMSHTVKSWPLLHADGSTTTEIVHSVRVPSGERVLTSMFSNDSALKTSVLEFLNMFALRVTKDYGYDEDSVHGIDWSSSYNCPPGAIQGVTVPLLTMGMTGSWEYLAAETIYENAKSSDKTLAFVEGANHTYDTCKQCETTAGQYGDTLKTTYDYADKWLSQKGRFLNSKRQ